MEDILVYMTKRLKQIMELKDEEPPIEARIALVKAAKKSYDIILQGYINSSFTGR